MEQLLWLEPDMNRFDWFAIPVTSCVKPVAPDEGEIQVFPPSSLTSYPVAPATADQLKLTEFWVDEYVTDGLANGFTIEMERLDVAEVQPPLSTVKAMDKFPGSVL
jgi:hypothetical protein